MVNGVITKKEWDKAEWLEDLLWEFGETELGKELTNKWCKTHSLEDYTNLSKAENEYLRQAGYFNK